MESNLVYIKTTFVDESYNCVIEIKNILNRLGLLPDDRNSLKNIAKIFHSFKSICSANGYLDISNLSGEFENIFKKFQKTKIVVPEELLKLTHQFADQICRLIEDDSPNNLLTGRRCEFFFNKLEKYDLKYFKKRELNKNKFHLNDSIQNFWKEAITYYISYHPLKNLGENCTKINLLFENLRSAGKCVIFPKLDKIPSLENFHSDSCYIYWEIILCSGEEKDFIKRIFTDQTPDCTLNIQKICEYDVLQDSALRKRFIEARQDKTWSGIEGFKELINKNEAGLNPELNKVYQIETPEKIKEDEIQESAEESILEWDFECNYMDSNKIHNAEPENLTETLILSDLTVRNIEMIKSDIEKLIKCTDKVTILFDRISGIDLSFVQLLDSLRKSNHLNQITFQTNSEIQADIISLLRKTGFSNILNILKLS